MMNIPFLLGAGLVRDIDLNCYGESAILYPNLERVSDSFLLQIS